MMRNLIFDLENAGSTYTRVNTVMLEENEKEEVAEEEKETKKKNPKAEKESAEKMRLKAMECNVNVEESRHLPIYVIYFKID